MLNKICIGHHMSGHSQNALLSNASLTRVGAQRRRVLIHLPVRDKDRAPHRPRFMSRALMTLHVSRTLARQPASVVSLSSSGNLTSTNPTV